MLLSPLRAGASPMMQSMSAASGTLKNVASGGAQATMRPVSAMPRSTEIVQATSSSRGVSSRCRMTA